MIIQGTTRMPSDMSGTDGQPYDLLLGKQSEGIFSELHGKYYTQTYRGRLWSASLATATAIPALATNATPNFFVVNPAGNMTNVVLVRLNVGFVAGTGIAGQIGYAYLPNAGGGGVGTLAPFSAFSTVAAGIKSGKIGQLYAGNIMFGSAATIGGVVPSALTLWRWSNLSQGAPITTTATAYSLFEDFDGTAILPPNTGFALVATAAIAETMMISLIAYEAPL